MTLDRLQEQYEAQITLRARMTQALANLTDSRAIAAQRERISRVTVRVQEIARQLKRMDG